MDEKNVTIKVVEFFRPTKIKLIIILLIFIFLEFMLIIFINRMSLDCFGPNCDLQAVHNSWKQMSFIGAIWINIFGILPFLILVYSLISIAEYFYKKYQSSTKEND